MDSMSEPGTHRLMWYRGQGAVCCQRGSGVRAAVAWVCRQLDLESGLRGVGQCPALQLLRVETMAWHTAVLHRVGGVRVSVQESALRDH